MASLLKWSPSGASSQPVTGTNSYTSEAVKPGPNDSVGFQVAVTGPLNGTLYVEVGNGLEIVDGDGEQWDVDDTITAIVVSAATTFSVRIPDVGFARARLRYENASGDGTIGASASQG